MVTTIPEIPDGGRYSTVQAAKILGVYKNTITNWRKRKLLKCKFHKHNGRPFFEGYELKRFWKAYY